MLFGHVVGFVPQNASPRNTKISSGFWRATFFHLRVRCKDRSNILGPDWGQAWPSWALLRYLEATALLLGAKSGDLEGKLGYREVMLKLSWAMLYYVEAICQILLGHVVGFASRTALSPAGPRFKWVSASYFGSIWGQIRPPCGYVDCYVGAILGPTSAILGLWHSQNQSKDTPSKRPPWPWRRNRIRSKTAPKHKSSAKMLTWKAVKAKRNQKSSQNPPSKRSPPWPCSLNLLRAWQNKGPPSSRATWDDDVFVKGTSSKARAPLASPAPTEQRGRVWGVFDFWERHSKHKIFSFVVVRCLYSWPQIITESLMSLQDFAAECFKAQIWWVLGRHAKTCALRVYPESTGLHFAGNYNVFWSRCPSLGSLGAGHDVHDVKSCLGVALSGGARECFELRKSSKPFPRFDFRVQGTLEIRFDQLRNWSSESTDATETVVWSSKAVEGEEHQAGNWNEALKHPTCFIGQFEENPKEAPMFGRPQKPCMVAWHCQSIGRRGSIQAKEALRKLRLEMKIALAAALTTTTYIFCIFCNFVAKRNMFDFICQLFEGLIV